MYDLFDSYDPTAEALSQQLHQAETVRSGGETQAVVVEEGATTNGYGGGWTNERIPQEQWDALYDGGATYDGGGAFNNTMTGYVFQWVPVAGGASLTAGEASTQSYDPETIVDEIIVTGKKIGFEHTLARLLAQMTPSTVDDLAIAIGSTLMRPGLHGYGVLDQVGDTQCDTDEAWEGLLLHAAPGQQSAAVHGGTVNIPGLGTVIQEVNYATKTITNITTPDHALYPGTVERSVVTEGGKVFIRTVGVGTGPMAGANVLGSNFLWGLQDRLIAQYVDANDNGPGDC